VFEHHVERLVQRALSVLRGLGIHPVGRYGPLRSTRRWPR
jgi:hypothetical protein